MHCRLYTTRVFLLYISVVIASAVLLTGCQPDNTKKIVVYTSVDQVFSEPVLKLFEKRTGIRVLPVYDVEAAKTTGLVNRLITEKDHPQADIFWNGEFVQTLLLQADGLLAPYQSPNSADIPAQYVDPQGYWTGFAGRARVLLVNTIRASRSVSPILFLAAPPPKLRRFMRFWGSKKRGLSISNSATAGCESWMVFPSSEIWFPAARL
jgi:iron(III) transport system substrate-binding protein